MTKINPQRFYDLMAEQSAIGATSDGGLNRPTGSDDELRVRQWFADRTQAGGLEFHADPPKP
jgi:hypothetical protein